MVRVNAGARFLYSVQGSLDDCEKRKLCWLELQDKRHSHRTYRTTQLPCGSHRLSFQLTMSLDLDAELVVDLLANP
jgi:hypothetical protein